MRNVTLKGSLSVLKLMPGTYFNQTGKPLRNPNTEYLSYKTRN